MDENNTEIQNMESVQSVNDSTQSDKAATNAANNSNVTYSQMSLDYVAVQVKKAHKKGLIQGFLITLGIVLLFALSITATRIVRSCVDGSIYASLQSFTGGSVLDKDTVEKINDIYRIIGNTYIDDVDKDTIRQGMYKGMLEALDDPYSVYYDKEEYTEMMESSSGTFEGIGAYLSQDPDTMDVTIVRPIKDSPAEAAGLLAGDIIVEVNGEDVTGQDLNVVVSKVRGTEGSEVRIGIKRNDEDDIIYFDVTRAKINEESVESELLEDNIGYIYISEFAEATGDQFKSAYDALLDEGMEYLIIDLRSNGGGYVDTSVEVADRLVKDGTIVSIKDRRGIGYSYDDNGDDSYSDVPIVVLVDGNTASASEILTGCLKDYNIATVIGTQTFGKGIVQDIIPLGDGSGIKITSSKYFTPNGENIHGIGIEPDYIVEFDKDRYIKDQYDNQLEAAKEYLLTGEIK